MKINAWVRKLLNSCVYRRHAYGLTNTYTYIPPTHTPTHTYARTHLHTHLQSYTHTRHTQDTHTYNQQVLAVSTFTTNANDSSHEGHIDVRQTHIFYITMNVITSGVNLVWNLGVVDPDKKMSIFQANFPKISIFPGKNFDFSRQIDEKFRFFQANS